MKAIDSAAKERVDAARLLGREVLWNGEAGELGDRRLVSTKLSLELPRGGRERRRAGGLRMERASGIVEQGALIGLVGDAERVDEGRHVGLGEVVTFDAREDSILLIGLQSGKGERERRADGATCNALLDPLRGMRADREAVGGPGRLLAERSGCLSDRQTVVLDEGREDLGLVERGRSARRRVCGEEDALVLDARCGALDEDRHHRAALVEPAPQSLDAIEDLESIGALDRGDTERELGERLNVDWACAAPETSVGGGQAIGRDVTDLASDAFLCASFQSSDVIRSNGRPTPGHGTSSRDGT